MRACTRNVERAITERVKLLTDLNSFIEEDAKKITKNEFKNQISFSRSQYFRNTAKACYKTGQHVGSCVALYITKPADAFIGRGRSTYEESRLIDLGVAGVTAHAVSSVIAPADHKDYSTPTKAEMIGHTVGGALNTLRWPTIITKYVIRGTFGLIGGALGLAAGTVRAMMND